MERPLRVGVVGAGVIGQQHLKHIAGHPDAVLQAIADPIDAAREAAAAEFEPARAYLNADRLIADSEVDAVTLAIPANIRRSVAKQALEAGKHLLIEKPVARSVAEVDELLTLQRPDQTIAVAESRFTFLNSFKAVRTAVRAAGGSASVYQISHAGVKASPPLPKTMPPNWRLSFEKNGGGIMSNWGCYDLDYLLALLDWEARVVEVSATWRLVPVALERWVPEGSDAETHVAAFLRLSTGATILLDRGEYLPVPETFNATTIVGDTWSVGCAIIAQDDSEFTRTRYDETGTQSDVIWSGPDDWEDLHRGVMHDFIDSIIEQREPATTLQRARHTQEITDAIYQSAREKRSITL